MCEWQVSLFLRIPGFKGPACPCAGLCLVLKAQCQQTAGSHHHRGERVPLGCVWNQPTLGRREGRDTGVWWPSAQLVVVRQRALRATVFVLEAG